MSNPVGKVDIHVLGRPNVKYGEITVNDDFTLEGFLFEELGQEVTDLLSKDPQTISFVVYAHVIGNAVKTDGDSHVHNG